MFIHNEAEQLPQGGPGIIILDVSCTVGKLVFWAGAVQTYLASTTAHTHVSAILVWKADYTATGVELSKEVIVNPRAASRCLQTHSGRSRDLVMTGRIT
jgi:hypothetical protein